MTQDDGRWRTNSAAGIQLEVNLGCRKAERFLAALQMTGKGRLSSKREISTKPNRQQSFAKPPGDCECQIAEVLDSPGAAAGLMNDVILGLP
jgi:hypothetical protein